MLVSVVIAYAVAVVIYSKCIVEYEYSLKGWPEVSEFSRSITVQPGRPERVRILSIDGGALLGLADLKILEEIEKRSGKRIYELFDFFAGTSTGAIISTLLLFPDDRTGQPMSAAQALQEYRTLSNRILKAPLYHQVLTGYGLFGPKFKNLQRIQISQELFDDGKFNDLLRPTMFPAFSRNKGGLKLFRNWNFLESNLYLSSLVTAVTSAPTIFPSIKLTGSKTNDDFISDATLILNSPSEFAYLYARNYAPKAKEFVIISIGTRWQFTISDRTSIYGGLWDWAQPLFGVMYRGQATVSNQILQYQNQMSTDVKISSVALAVEVPYGVTGFNADPQYIRLIEQAGQNYISKHSSLIDDVINILVRK